MLCKFQIQKRVGIQRSLKRNNILHCKMHCGPHLNYEKSEKCILKMRNRFQARCALKERRKWCFSARTLKDILPHVATV